MTSANVAKLQKLGRTLIGEICALSNIEDEAIEEVAKRLDMVALTHTFCMGVLGGGYPTSPGFLPGELADERKFVGLSLERTRVLLCSA